MADAVSKPRRPFGRSLTDFASLSDAEQQLIASVARGEICVLGDEVPDGPTRANAIRPELIRFLALGGDDCAPVHEKGVQLIGAFIGDFDTPAALSFEGAKLVVRVGLALCRFDQPIELSSAEGHSIDLRGGALKGIRGERIRLADDLTLRDVKTTAEVRLSGAVIDGDICCTNGHFENAGDNAFCCDGAEIGGAVYLNGDFLAQGSVRLTGSKICGDLICTGGRFDSPEDVALMCDGAEIGGRVALDGKFHSIGMVSLVGTSVRGYLSCNDSQYENARGFALNCESARVNGSFFFRRVNVTRGNVSMLFAKVKTLADDIESWPLDALLLDGFQYDHIAAGAPFNARSRIAWLGRQIPRFNEGDWFALQPWMQLAKVLREQGHFRDAAEVDIAREDRLRAAGKVADHTALKKWLHAWGKLGPDGRYTSFFSIVARLDDFIAWALHWFYGQFSGYGHRPMRIVYSALFIWLTFAGVYCFAASDGHFAPANAASVNAIKSSCQKQFAQTNINWTQCEALLVAYPQFSPLAYSLDLILPVARLGQSNMWTPISDGSWFSLSGWTQRLVWFEEVFGWVAALTLGAIAAGLVKRRDG